MRSRILPIVIALSFLVTSCSSERGGVFVDASGEQGGGTQPGGGGFAFVILFIMVASCAIAMFTMDRIRKNKSQEPKDDDK